MTQKIDVDKSSALLKEFMLFNSYQFILLFFPLVFTVFFCLIKFDRIDLAKFWLLLASLFFYAFWDTKFLPLLMISILFNFLLGKIIFSSFSQRKIILIMGIVVNLLILMYYKYLGFFQSLFSNNAQKNMMIPLGISFFTFTQIAYLIDIYKKKTTSSNLISYCLFVTIFPHQIAGPILHHNEMIKQFDDKKTYLFSILNCSQGLFLFSLGLFKKVLIADSLLPIVSSVFNISLTSFSLIQAWVGAIAYSLQLYFDFSGYSDMAVGLGLFFNVKLPINFNSPYQANSIIDFWRRWHITLSIFLKDYLYIPLGGNKNNIILKYRNLFLTMLLGGLWHGAGWTFILWGILHGIFLIINHLVRDLKIFINNTFSRIITLVCIVLSWVVFRSESLEQSYNILKSMLGFGQGYLRGTNRFDILLICGLVFSVLLLPNSNYYVSKIENKPIRYGLITAILFFLSFINLDQISEFIYYQF